MCMKMRGTLTPEHPFTVPPDLFFYSEPTVEVRGMKADVLVLTRKNSVAWSSAQLNYNPQEQEVLAAPDYTGFGGDVGKVTDYFNVDLPMVEPAVQEGFAAPPTPSWDLRPDGAVSFLCLTCQPYIS